MTLAEQIEQINAARDEWIVGGGGSETPFTRNGRTYLYVWNPATGQHGFLDLSTDIVIDDHSFYAEGY